VFQSLPPPPVRLGVSLARLRSRQRLPEPPSPDKWQPAFQIQDLTSCPVASVLNQLIDLEDCVHYDFEPLNGEPTGPANQRFTQEPESAFE
jgi:hypothetical protein